MNPPKARRKEANKAQVANHNRRDAAMRASDVKEYFLFRLDVGSLVGGLKKRHDITLGFHQAKQNKMNAYESSILWGLEGLAML